MDDRWIEEQGMRAPSAIASAADEDRASSRGTHAEAVLVDAGKSEIIARSMYTCVYRDRETKGGCDVRGEKGQWFGATARQSE